MMTPCRQCGVVFETNRSKRLFCSRACANRHTSPIRAERQNAAEYTDVWSCGGGVDSVAIAVLIVTGRLEKPTYAVMANCGYERPSTMAFVRGELVPRLAAAGVNLNVIGTARKGYVDLVDSAGSVRVPAYEKMPDGSVRRFRTWCCNGWKAAPIRRWLAERGVKRRRTWLGFAADEARRANTRETGADTFRYPLIERGMTRAACLYEIGRANWPMPMRTSCYLCPAQRDEEWRELRRNEPQVFQLACNAERRIQERRPRVWLHRSCVALADALGGG